MHSPHPATHLLLVRHGQSLQNSNAALEDYNSGLTELGWRQARAVAEWLARRYRPDAVLVSTLTRAQQTGEVIAERFGVGLKLHEGIEEAEQSYWAEMPFSQETPLAAWDDVWQPNPQTSPRYFAFRTRLQAGLSRLLADYAGKTVIVVTHGGVIGTILRSLFGGHHLSVFTENSGVTHLTWEGHHWRLEYHNSTVHLDGLRPAAEPATPEPRPLAAPWAEDRQSEIVVRHYQTVAAALPALPPALSDRDLRELVRMAAPAGDDRVLDAGTGAGAIALAFAPHVASMLGIDLSAAMLEHAERSRSARGATNVRFRLGEVGSLGLPEGSFEIIICHDLLHYVTDPSVLFDRFRQLFGPGGRLLIDEVIGCDDPVKRATQNAIELRRDPAITEILSAGEIEHALAAAGFRIDRSERYTQRLDLDDWLAVAAADDATRSAVQSMIEAGLDADSAGLAARRTREGQISITQTRLRLLAAAPQETD